MKYLSIMIFCISMIGVPSSMKASESDWSTSGSSGNGGGGNSGGGSGK